MGDRILGLTSGKTFTEKSYHNMNHRRRVFHDNPTGAAPLTGLLSLMDTEEVDDPEFGWWEKRFDEPETTAKNAVQVFGTTGDVYTDSDPAYTGPDGTGTAGSSFKLKVTDASEFRVRHVVMLCDFVLEDTSTANIKCVVDGVNTTTHVLTLRLISGDVEVENTLGAQNGKQIIVIGNANAEGTTATSGHFRPPIKLTNYTQIFRNAFSFTRTSLKVPMDFDKSGIYKEKAKDNAIDHMVEMEKAFLFGVKAITHVADPEDGEMLPERTTGGVGWFIDQYEAANSAYRGGTGAAAVTLNSQDDKRRLTSLSSITGKQFNEYLERAFRTTNNKAFEKLFLCGNGFLAVINNWLENSVTANKNMRSESVYGFNVTTWETPFGTVHFKTHPLFNRNAAWRNDGLLLDVQNMRYRPLNESDTTLLKNRQKRAQDRRKDEWLTESGLELRFPESHMIFEGLTALT